MSEKVYIYETSLYKELPKLETDSRFTSRALLQQYPEDYDVYTEGSVYPLHTLCMKSNTFDWWCSAIDTQNEMYRARCNARRTLKMKLYTLLFIFICIFTPLILLALYLAWEL